MPLADGRFSALEGGGGGGGAAGKLSSYNIMFTGRQIKAILANRYGDVR